MGATTFIEQLRQELPRLLRDYPEIRHELWGMMLEVFPSRQEFMALLEEMRAFREETTRRFAELRQDMDRRFEAVIAELRRHGDQLHLQSQQLRDLTLHVSSLGSRVGHGLEHMVREVVEEFAGETFTVAQRLVIRDEAGEVFGVAGADVEFDLYVHNGRAYLVEVKSHLKANDVLVLYRKVEFAKEKLARQIIPFVLALSMEPKAERQMKQLGIQYRVRAIIGRDDGV